MVTFLIVCSFTVLGYGYGWANGYDSKKADKKEAKEFVDRGLI